MTRHELLRELLDEGWTEAALRRAADRLSRLEADPETLHVLRDYDRVRDAVRAPDGQGQEAEPAGGWDALQSRLLAEAASAGPETRRSRAGRARYRLGSFGPALLAACLAIGGGFGGWMLGDRGGSPDGSPVAAAAPVAEKNGQAVPSPDDVAMSVRAFREVADMLDHQAAWVSLSEDASDVGVLKAPLRGQERLMLLRLSVHRNGHPVSRNDLVIVPGHSADLKLPMPDGRDLRYVVSVSDERVPTLSLWAEVTAPNQPATTLAALATQLRAQPGRAQPAGEFVAGSDEYRLKVGFAEAASGAATTPRPRKGGDL